MTLDLEDVRELHELNVELLEILLVLGQRFIKYMNEYEIRIEGREKLAALIVKAICLLERIGTPYRENPIRQTEDRSPRDKLTPYPSRGGGGRSRITGRGA